VHNSVKEHAGRYFAELRRRYYITPKSYLDLIASYSSTLDECRSGIEARRPAPPRPAPPRCEYSIAPSSARPARPGLGCLPYTAHPPVSARAQARKRRLDVGLYKLTSTNEMVDGMKKQLAELEPVLKEKAAATAELLIQASLRAVSRARCAPAQRACRERGPACPRTRTHIRVHACCRCMRTLPRLVVV
jgi:dynein heavy chain